MRTYQVSGIVQFEIQAKSAKEATRKAIKSGMAVERTRNNITISLDNIGCQDHPEGLPIDLMDHDQLDEAMKS